MDVLGAAALSVLLERKRAKEPILNLIEAAKPLAASSSRRIAVQCSRRAAKSYSIASIFMSRALTVPNSRYLYLALTQRNVRRIVWSIFTKLVAKYAPSAKMNSTSLMITFPNGSMVELSGADGTTELADRFLGAFYDGVAIDEAGSFDPTQLDYLIDEVLTPTLIDRAGTLYLLGSPQPVDKGRFYEACHNSYEYDYYHWTTDQNPYIAKQFAQEIQRLKDLNPLVHQEAWFRRNYLNEWAKDNQDRVYRYSPALNTAPPDTSSQYERYIGGVDIGYEDPNAFVICGIKSHDTTLYVLEAYKKNHILLPEIAAILKRFEARYPGISWHVDSAAKGTIMELTTRFDCPVMSCKKTGTKWERIQAINADLSLGMVKFLPEAGPVVEEMLQLPIKETPKGPIEHPAFDNHLTDAFSYAWIEAYHFTQQPATPPIAEEDKYLEQLMKHNRRRRRR